MDARAFAALSEKARARRLRGAAERALPSYDLEVGRMELLSNSWNCVFRLETDGGPLALRVALPGHGHGTARMHSERAMLDAVAAEGIRAPRVVRARDGAPFVTVRAPDVPGPRDVMIFTWVPGRDLADAIGPPGWEALGRLFAALHRFGARWSPPPGFSVLRYDRVFHHPGRVTLLDGQVDLGDSWDAIEAALPMTDARIAALLARDGATVTHGDLHHWNVKLHQGSAYPIDFEDLQWATPTLDLATSLYYVRWRDDYAALAAALRRGYEESLPWVEREPGEIDRLLFSRGADLVNIFVTDPNFKIKDWGRTVTRLGTLARIALGQEEAVVIG